MSLFSAVILQVVFLCQNCICIPVKMVDSTSIDAKDIQKRQEINEIVEGNFFSILTFACISSTLKPELNTKLLRT